MTHGLLATFGGAKKFRLLSLSGGRGAFSIPVEIYQNSTIWPLCAVSGARQFNFLFPDVQQHLSMVGVGTKSSKCEL